VVVATMGRADEEALAAALATDAGYIGLVASTRRGRVVLDALRARGFGEEALARVRTPAGLDLGPSTQPEIAVAILAELVAWRHRRDISPAPLAEGVDPVCGMTVTVTAGTEAATYQGTAYHFCCGGCRRTFEADPARYVAVGGEVSA
jgi:xanthine dehydrogenase accessory factor